MPSLKLDQTTPERKSPTLTRKTSSPNEAWWLNKAAKSIGTSQGRCPSQMPSRVSCRSTQATQYGFELHVSSSPWWGEATFSCREIFCPPTQETLNRNVLRDPSSLEYLYIDNLLPHLTNYLSSLQLPTLYGMYTQRIKKSFPFSCQSRRT